MNAREKVEQWRREAAERAADPIGWRAKQFQRQPGESDADLKLRVIGELSLPVELASIEDVIAALPSQSESVAAWYARRRAGMAGVRP